MITFISEVNDTVKLEVTLDNQVELPEPPAGFEWFDASCVADHLRGVRVLILGQVLK